MGKSNKKKKKEKKVFGIFDKKDKKDKGTKVKTTSKTPGIAGKHSVTVQSTGTKKGGWNAWTKKTKPTIGKDPETLSVVLYKQSTLDEIARLCKPKANASEFQVHFRGVQYIVQKPDSNKRMVFTIPTAFFNMPQKVTSASVDFNLDEVAAISEEIAPISLDIGNKISKSFPVEFFKSLGFTVTARELEMGSIHRHPGDFGFSSTDLDNQVEKPGVIFRNRGCDDKVQVDSVMYLPGEKVKIVVTETRVVTVKPLDDGGIEGHYLETPTVSYIIQDKVYTSGFEEFFGGKEDDTTEIKYTVDQKWIDKKYPQIKDIFDAFLAEFDYDPMLLIDPELIEQEYASWYKRNGSSYNYGKNKTYGNNYGNYWDADAWDDDGFGDDEDYVSWAYDKDATETDGRSGTTPKERETLTRPPWRKTQTLGKLRVLKIDPKSYPAIDGSASDQDIIAIVTAMKEEGYSDIEIRQLFTDCAYPASALATYYTNLADTM